ncbi:hypothetical protein [Nocardioides sp. L-11A]|uniref:hypothetical protein n=1 Tax=Nocardioides sp. L-11A TaxID=3043848 RepID=UPI00249A4EE5|nr:hypothetical protein QJ852_22255 [Nocardioides sp. L-11A]
MSHHEDEGTAADRQAAQQAREQEKRYADSATAVSPDTQGTDPEQAIEESPFTDSSARGQSTTFEDPPKPARQLPGRPGPARRRPPPPGRPCRRGPRLTIPIRTPPAPGATVSPRLGVWRSW